MERVILTSYFGNIKKIDNDENLIPISIARKKPVWYKGKEFKDLAPYSYMLNLSFDEYTIKFFEILTNLNLNKVVSAIDSMSGNKRPVLLCYEKYNEELESGIFNAKKVSEIVNLANTYPENFCHRHLVARWFKSYEIDCRELGVPQSKNPTVKQTSLF